MLLQLLAPDIFHVPSIRQGDIGVQRAQKTSA